MPTELRRRAELEALFADLSEELDRLHVSADVVMVGGAWMLWHAQRASTRDVDAARRLPAEIAGAVAVLAQRHDLAPGWLNDDATAFWPTTADYADCVAVYQTSALIVRTPPPSVMFLMKLHRALPQDVEDMILLWPLCEFADPDEAATAYAEAYPLSIDDPYMATFIADHIVANA